MKKLNLSPEVKEVATHIALLVAGVAGVVGVGMAAFSYYGPVTGFGLLAAAIFLLQALSDHLDGVHVPVVVKRPSRRQRRNNAGGGQLR